MYQPSFFAPESAWRPPRLAELPQDWNVSPRVGLDTETCDPLLKKLGPGVRRGGYVAGVSFAFGPAKGWYTPMRHLGGDNMEEDPAQVVAYYKHQAATYRGEIVGAKLGYDIDFLAELGITFPRATFRDVQVAEPLLDENQFQYNLDAILKRHGLDGKNEELLREAASQFKTTQGKILNPKSDMWMLPARYVGPYAEGDATKPMELLEKQEALIDSRGLRGIWDLESDVLPVLVKMRRHGVVVDLDHLDLVERFARAEEMKAWGELQRVTGVAVRLGDAMKAEVIAHALKAVGIVPPNTPQGKPSIKKEWLEALDHPAGALIRRGRKMSQLKSTFIDSVREHAIIKNGEARIHCTFNQGITQEDDEPDTEGARPGRLSCCDLNVQQQPARDKEIGPLWRRVYKPDKGKQWGSLDYSQQEPGIALHFAVASGPARIGQVAYRSACEAAERKRNDPNMDYHTMFTSMVHGDHVLAMSKDSKELKALRDPAKNIYLGICYGMGGAKLCHSLGYETKVIEGKNGRRYEVAGDKGQALLDLVDRRVPYVRKTAEAFEKVAKERGYIITILGRHCHFPMDSHGNYDWTYKSFNRGIQGSAADQTKKAMVDMDRAGALLQLQVHDEVDLSLENREEGLRYAEIMETCVPLLVPIKVDLEMGPSWGEIK